jgi:hypothetical protein
MPQFFTLVFRSTQVLPQRVVPCGHSQTPLLQTPPTGHSLPQVPQFFTSVDLFTQVLPQGDKPPGQTQTPFTQSAPEGQEMLHPPQSVRLV